MSSNLDYPSLSDFVLIFNRLRDEKSPAGRTKKEIDVDKNNDTKIGMHRSWEASIRSLKENNLDLTSRQRTAIVRQSDS